MEQLLLAPLLLATTATLLWLNRRTPSYTPEEPLDYADIYQGRLIALLKNSSQPLGSQRRNQGIALNRPIEAPRDYAPWDGKARDGLDEALVLSARS